MQMSSQFVSDANHVVCFVPQNVLQAESLPYPVKNSAQSVEKFTKNTKNLLHSNEKKTVKFIMFNNFFVRISFGLSWAQMEFLNSLFSRGF